MHQITSVTPPAVVTASPQPDRLTSLENKLEELSKKFDEVKLLSGNTSTRKRNTVDMICYNCGQKGHSKRNCMSMSMSSVRCQLCDKNGHSAKNCRISQPPGNFRSPMDAGRHHGNEQTRQKKSSVY